MLCLIIMITGREFYATMMILKTYLSVFSDKRVKQLTDMGVGNGWISRDTTKLNREVSYLSWYLWQAEN